MGGTIFSVLGGVLPFQANFIFFVLVGVVGYGIYLPYQERKKYGPSRGRRKKAKRRSPASDPKKPSEQQDHIPSATPSVQARLEQLRSLKEAGLMDSAEYERRKDAILKGP